MSSYKGTQLHSPREQEVDVETSFQELPEEEKQNENEGRVRSSTVTWASILQEAKRAGAIDAPAEISADEFRDMKRDTVTRPATTAMGLAGSKHHHHGLTLAQKRREAQYVSYDFDLQESTAYLASRKRLKKGYFQRAEIVSWFIIFFMGLFTGVAAGIADVAIYYLVQLKFAVILDPLSSDPADDYYKPVLLFILFNAVLCTIASSFVVFIEPCAAGSGIPEIKSILNGTRLPGVLRAKTLVAKMTGVIFSTAGGLPIGKEGPMIHSGSILGAGLSQGTWHYMGKKISLLEPFRRDSEKRDFVAAGAAAGVAAAFGAPIGGVLFAVEEGASFWRQSMTWKSFFGAMVSGTILQIITGQIIPGQRRDSSYGILQTPSSVEFGAFTQANTYAPPTIGELPLFVLEGVILGVVSGLFCKLQEKITIFRMRFIPGSKPLRRWAEAIFVSLLVSSIGGGMSVLFSINQYACSPLGQTVEFFNLTGNYRYNVTLYPPAQYMGEIRQFFCPTGEYNQAATLWFQQSEGAIRQLFHNEQKFSLLIVGIYFITYWFLACITYGIAVPSGLFVPSLCTGAGLGRLYGEVLKLILPAYASYVGNYALLGAAGMLSGMARITISLCVIIVETTQDITYLLPTMISVLFAKFLADLFGKGLYDTHIDLKNVPLLEWEYPPEAEFVLAKHVQKTDVVVMDEVMQVEDIVKTLKSTPYGAFPVISRGASGDAKTYVGLITRYQLTSLLEVGAWTKTQEKPEPQGDEFNTSPSYRLPVSEDRLREFYNYWPKINQVDIPFEAYTKWLDLTPYMNPAAYTASHVAPLSRVFRIFRYLGLRHLPVISRGGQVVGMITRKDITEHAIADAYWSLQEVSLELSEETSGKY